MKILTHGDDVNVKKSCLFVVVWSYCGIFLVQGLSIVQISGSLVEDTSPRLVINECYSRELL